MGRMTAASDVAHLFEYDRSARDARGRPHRRGDGVRVRRAARGAGDRRPAFRQTPTSRAVMEELRQLYAGRGVNLVRVAGRWTFRTAEDLSWLLAREGEEKRKLSRAAIETLAIIAYHQPVTRADIEEIRGVAVSKGALDVLMEAGWVRMRGRRKAPGRPITYGTTTEFLIQFGLEAISDLPGLDELQGGRAFRRQAARRLRRPQPERRAGVEGGRRAARRARAARAGVGADPSRGERLTDADRRRHESAGNADDRSISSIVERSWSCNSRVSATALLLLPVASFTRTRQRFCRSRRIAPPTNSRSSIRRRPAASFRSDPDRGERPDRLRISRVALRGLHFQFPSADRRWSAARASRCPLR